VQSIDVLPESGDYAPAQKSSAMLETFKTGRTITLMSNPAATSNPSGPNRDRGKTGRGRDAEFAAAEAEITEVFEPAADPDTDPAILVRRYTAPSSFDGNTQIINPVPDPETELMPPAGSQVIPGTIKTPRNRRSWGWVIALVLVIAAITAVAILATVMLTHKNSALNAEWPPTTQNFAIHVS
jgi:hypothetical protein